MKTCKHAKRTSSPRKTFVCYTSVLLLFFVSPLPRSFLLFSRISQENQSSPRSAARSASQNGRSSHERPFLRFFFPFSNAKSCLNLSAHGFYLGQSPSLNSSALFQLLFPAAPAPARSLPPFGAEFARSEGEASNHSLGSSPCSAFDTPPHHSDQISSWRTFVLLSQDPNSVVFQRGKLLV